MNNIEHLLDTIASNPLYTIIAISISILIIWSLIKKLYKLAIIFGICCLVYLVYIFFENPIQAQKDFEMRKRLSTTSIIMSDESVIDKVNDKV